MLMLLTDEVATVRLQRSHVSGAVVPNAMDTNAVTTPITPAPANNPLAAMYAWSS
jgi:hypothetical protein